MIIILLSVPLLWSQGRVPVTVDTGNCALSVNLYGGFDSIPPDTGFISPDTGTVYGFIYPRGGFNHLYWGAFLVGNSDSTVHDHFYGQPASRAHWGWVPSDTFIDIIPPWYGAHEMYKGSMVDSGNPTRAQGFKVYVIPAGRGAPLAEFDDFVIVCYDVWNMYGDTLNNVYVGVMLDFDLGTGATTNYGFTDPARRLVFMTPTMSNHNPTVGVRLLYPRIAANLSLIDHALYVYPATQMTELTKFGFLSGTIRMPRSNRAYDWSICVSAGPFSLIRGQWARVVFAVIGGNDTISLKRHADSAQSWYDHEWLTEVEEEKNYVMAGSKFRIIPNPAKNRITFDITDLPAQKPLIDQNKIVLKIYDVSGKLRMALSVRVEPTRQQFSVDVAGLPAGTYFVELTAGTKREIQKLVLIR